MPEKIKPSVKHTDRKTGKTWIEHFYLKSTPMNELQRLLGDERANKKLKVKCMRELTRRRKLQQI